MMLTKRACQAGPSSVEERSQLSYRHGRLQIDSDLLTSTPAARLVFRATPPGAEAFRWRAGWRIVSAQRTAVGMETLGAAAIGSKWSSWVLPMVSRQTPIAFVWSLVEAEIVVAGVGVVFRLQAGAAAAAGVAIAPLSTWHGTLTLTRGLDT